MPKAKLARRRRAYQPSVARWNEADGKLSPRFQTLKEKRALSKQRDWRIMRGSPVTFKIFRKRMGIGEPWAWRLLYDRKKDIQLGTAVKMCRALEITIDKLISWRAAPPEDLGGHTRRFTKLATALTYESQLTESQAKAHFDDLIAQEVRNAPPQDS